MQANVRDGSPGGRSETTGVGFVKEVGFKPGVREGVMDVQSGESEEVTGEGIGESKLYNRKVSTLRTGSQRCGSLGQRWGRVTC